jgi:flavorubredoxin
MKARTICDNVYLLGAVDWDRRLFDALIPLPEGTSYNAYLVQGSEKTALIDTVDPSKWHELEAQLATVPRLDYVVIQHTEQDHSGILPKVLALYPDAKVVTNERCLKMCVDHLHVDPARGQVVADGDTLSLGDKTLAFVITPWVHWPETMCTWLAEDAILFSCDFFGSHLATSDVFADEGATYRTAKRYYAEIMQPFATQVAKDLDKVSAFPLSTIAPSHGPAWARPSFIMDAYRDWATAAPRNLVCLPYVTMHESTRLMVDALTSDLVERGVAVERFDLTVADVGDLAASLVDAATIVLGTPTVLAGPHPLAAYAAFLANALKPKARHAAVIGSFGWGGKTVEKLVEMMPNLKVELLGSVLAKGLPHAGDYADLESLADAIAERHVGLAAR